MKLSSLILSSKQSSVVVTCLKKPLGCSARHRRYVSSSSSNNERVTVPIRNSGSIDIDIHHPRTTASTANLSCLIYLPPVPPNLLTPAQSRLHGLSLSPTALATKTHLPVLTPHYRTGPTHSYPTPIHDVALSYDWIANWAQKHLNQSRSLAPNSDHGQAQNQGQIKLGIASSTFGASLALSLAVTSCRTDTPARISSVFVHDPVLDWVFEGDAAIQSQDSGNTKAKERDEEKKALYTMRHDLFKGRYPYTYFDPFISPMHFLRSPSVRVPNGRGEVGVTSEDSDEDIEGTEGMEVDEGVPSLSTLPSPSAASIPASPVNSTGPGGRVKRPMPLDDPRRFKRPLRFPPIHLAPTTVLPDIHVLVGAGSVLRPQAEEFVRLLRRGMFRDRGYRMGKGLERMLVDREAMSEAVEFTRQQGQEGGDERVDLAVEGWNRFQVSIEERGKREEDVVARWFTREG